MLELIPSFYAEVCRLVVESPSANLCRTSRCVEHGMRSRVLRWQTLGDWLMPNLSGDLGPALTMSN
jgi:hypothetical protein